MTRAEKKQMQAEMTRRVIALVGALDGCWDIHGRRCDITKLQKLQPAIRKMQGDIEEWHRQR